MGPPFLEVMVVLGCPGRLDNGEGDDDKDDNRYEVAIQKALHGTGGHNYSEGLRYIW
jgi:hypothetical protein